MTTKADLPALGAFVRDLGADLAQHGEEVWKRSQDWQQGARSAPGPAASDPCTCAHTPEQHHRDGQCTFSVSLLDEVGGIWACMCEGYNQAAAEDPLAAHRRDESKQAAMAALEHDALVRDIVELERAALALRKRYDRLRPPRPASSKKDPETAAEVALEGYCSNCWLNDCQMVPITIDRRTDKPMYRDWCEWCGRMKGLHGFLPDRPILELRHAGRSVTSKDWDAATVRHRARKTEAKKGKRKKGKRAA